MNYLAVSNQSLYALTFSQGCKRGLFSRPRRDRDNQNQVSRPSRDRDFIPAYVGLYR